MSPILAALVEHVKGDLNAITDATTAVNVREKLDALTTIQIHLQRCRHTLHTQHKEQKHG